MSGKHIYTNKNLTIIKIISLAVLILICYRTVNKFYNLIYNSNNTDYTIIDICLIILSFSLNFMLIIFSAIMLKYPQKFSLIGIESLVYSLAMSIIDSNSYLSLLMLCVTFSTLLLRNNFEKIKKKALISFILLYLFELLIL